MEDKFETELIKQVRDHGAIANFMDKYTAPPEAICRSVLELGVSSHWIIAKYDVIDADAMFHYTITHLSQDTEIIAVGV